MSFNFSGTPCIQMCSGSSMFVFMFSHDYLLRIDTE